MAKTTTGTAHRHRDSRGKWVTDELPHTHDFDETSHPADVLTADQVSKLVLIAAGGGGTTPQPPNTPPTIPNIAPAGITVSVTTTTATVSWTTTDASTGLVQYGTTTTYGSSTSSTSSGTTGTRTLTSLTPGQSYHFRVQTTSGSTVVYSSDRTFTTTAVTVPPAPPGAPTNLVATGGNTQIVLTWTAPSSNGGSSITGYHLYRNGASLVTLGNVLTYTNTGLTNGLTYSYTVAAITAVGEGPQGNTASATPAAAGDTNPPVISGVTVSSITTTSAVVSATTNEASTVIVRYGTTTAVGSSTSATSSGTTHSRTLSGLLPNQLYYFRVDATDTAGNLAQDSVRQFTTPNTTPPPGRPFAAPVTTNTVNVSVGANVQSVVNAAPDGTEFVFPANTLFTMTNGIAMTNRHNLVFTGNGSTIRTTNQDGSTNSSCFKLDNLNSHIAINNFTLQGSNPDTGTNIFHGGVESQMGVAVFDGQQIEVGNCRIRNVYGDFIYVEGKNSATTRPSADVWVHDNAMDYCGRMGIVPNSVTNMIVERNTLDHIGLICVDVESNYSYEVVDGLYFRDNTVGQYSLSGYQTNWFFACAAVAGAAYSNFNVLRNTVTGGALANANNQAGKAGLATRVDSTDRVNGFNFIGNSTTVSGYGRDGYPTPLYFQHVDGLVVTGNTQPLTSGSLTTAGDCPGATLSPNP